MNIFSTPHFNIDRFEIDRATATNVEEQIPEPDHGLHAYPNPAVSWLTVSHGTPGPARIDIHNMLGQVVRSIEATDSRTQLTVGDLPRGVYMVRVADSAGDLQQQPFVLR